MGDKYTKEELTDLYPRDLPDPDGKAAFGEEMRGDDTLAREVELSRHIVNAIERKGEQGAVRELAEIGSTEELKRILSLAEAEHGYAGRGRKLWRWGGVAAAAAVIVVAIIGIQPRYPARELYGMSYERPVYDPAVSRGEAEVPVELKQMLDDAGTLYESRDMPGAAGIYDKAAETFPSSLFPDDALFYRAVALAETGRTEEARNTFSELAAKPDSEYAQDALWQDALLRLRLGERREARAVLDAIERDGGIYSTEAGELLVRLKQKRLF